MLFFFPRSPGQNLSNVARPPNIEISLLQTISNDYCRKLARESCMKMFYHWSVPLVSEIFQGNTAAI